MIALAELLFDRVAHVLPSFERWDRGAVLRGRNLRFIRQLRDHNGSRRINSAFVEIEYASACRVGSFGVGRALEPLQSGAQAISNRIKGYHSVLENV